MKPPSSQPGLYPEQETRVIIPAATPTIETERLSLRPLELSHAEAIFEYSSRPEVAIYLLSRKPQTEIQETEYVINKKTFQTPDASGAVGRRFAFAVTQREDPAQKAIGIVSINSLMPAPSVGYGIHPDFWRSGYTTEAVAALVDAWWKLERKDMGGDVQPEKLYAGCDTSNVGSVKVLLKNGFQLYEERQLEDELAALFCMERP
ncbi:hypothetical protein N7478_006323 [Penicillium angulare]|uniref:uncharacterized protein n=1 Tax=Penicillium angulare TaxID=116970 RepID=UPI00254028CA|nr:uncharacterized protein N7478_006323 [Penicillium angulare]KAJ5280951.1 hypothetical protein N7478_006323 [Penicillium angulare]